MSRKNDFQVSPKFRQFAKTNYRRYVGPEWAYDLKGAFQFMVCVALGLRANHHFLEVGCGSMRAGRLFLAYLDPGRYCGMDARGDVPEKAIAQEIGEFYWHTKIGRLAINNRFYNPFEQDFDMILAHAVMIHLGYGDLALLFDSVQENLKPGGMFLGNWQIGDDCHKESVVYPEITRYRVGTMERLVCDAGLRFELLELNDYRGNTKWFIATHPESAPATRPDSLVGMINNFWEGYR